MKSPYLTALSILSLLGVASADIYTLKDGTEYNGRIALETKDSYILSVEIKKGIRDEVTVKKSDVKSISKSDNSKSAYEKLTSILPTDDLLEIVDYNSIITTKITPFYEKYPKSTYTSEVKKIESVLRSEMDQIQDGAIKVNGKWTSPEEAALNKYEIEAIVLAKSLERKAKSGDFSGALLILSNMEDGYENTKPYRDSVALCLKFLPHYKKRAQSIVDNHETVMKKKNIVLQGGSSDDIIRLKQLLAKEEQSYQAKLAAAKEAKSPWQPLNRFHPDEAKKIISKIEKEREDLEEILEDEFTDAGALYREILVALDTNELDIAKSKLREFMRARAPKEHTAYLKELLTNAVAEMRLIERQKRIEEREAIRKAAEDARKPKEETEKKSGENAALDKLKDISNIDQRDKQIDQVKR